MRRLHSLSNVKEPINYYLCLSTVDEKSNAIKMAKILLQQKLVACVNISAKHQSLYHWQGKIVEDSEYLLQMKTSSQKIEALKSTIKDIHPYENPELIVLDIIDGSLEYLNWISQSLQD